MVKINNFRGDLSDISATKLHCLYQSLSEILQGRFTVRPLHIHSLFTKLYVTVFGCVYPAIISFCRRQRRVASWNHVPRLIQKLHKIHLALANTETYPFLNCHSVSGVESAPKNALFWICSSPVLLIWSLICILRSSCQDGAAHCKYGRVAIWGGAEV